MSIIWDNLIAIQDRIIEKLEVTGEEIEEAGMDQFNQPGWINRVWSGDLYRRAHIDVVDAREDKNLWMMHVCIFPHLDSDAPIFGFDVIAGPNKMTGAFCDLSATTSANHKMIKQFSELTDGLEWRRERTLPDWAQSIFSEGMMAAGMVKEQSEIDQISDIVDKTLNYYIAEVRRHRRVNSEQLGKEAQNRYAHYQKKNKHTPRVMKSLGLNEDDVDIFVEKCLFPEII